MLEGLEAVNWAALGHAYGSAEDVPQLLGQVRSADPKVRKDAVQELCSTIVHQGTRYSATTPAVPYLVELATAPETHDRARLVHLLTYAAIGYDHASLPNGITLDQLRHTTNMHGGEHTYGAWALAAYQAVQAALPALLPCWTRMTTGCGGKRPTCWPGSHRLHRPACRACAPGWTMPQAGTPRPP
jgi:hypothetical protein